MFIDNEIVRFPEGVNNQPEGNIFNAMRQMDPTLYHQAMHDFDLFQTAGVVAGTDDNWQFLTTGNGSISKLTGTSFSDGGVLQLNTGAAAGSDVAVNRRQTTFMMVPGRRAFFKAKFHIPVFGGLNAEDLVFMIGLAGNRGDEEFPENGVFWSSEGGGREMDLYWSQGGTFEQELGLLSTISVPDNEDITVSFYWDGVDRITGNFNDELLRTEVITPLRFPTTPLFPIVFVGNNGIATFGIFNVDYIYVALER